MQGNNTIVAVQFYEQVTKFITYMNDIMLK